MINHSVNIERVIGEIGPFGIFQIINYILIAIPLAMQGTYDMAYIFTAGNLNYRCKVINCENDTQISDFNAKWINFAIPKNFNKQPSNCYQYNFVSLHNRTDSVCVTENFDSTSVEKCHDFIYENDEKTILNEWNLTCDENEWKLTTIGTLNAIGQIISLLISGYIADHYGRRFLLILAMVLSGIIGSLKAFSFHYVMFAVLEILNSMVSSGVYGSGLILAMELVGQKYHGFGGIFLHFSYSLGIVLLGVVAMQLQNWRLLLLSIYLPTFIISVYLIFIPESVRWLLSKEHYSKALEVLQKVASYNRNQLSAETINEFEHLTQNEIKAITDVVDNTLWEMLQNGIIRKRFVLCALTWFINCFLYYGMNIISITIGRNKFESFIFASLVELPAIVASWALAYKIGRVKLQVMTMYAIGCMCFALTFIDDKSRVYIVLFLAGKFMITISFTILTIYTVEIFPTTFRNRLYGLCSMFGKFGMIIATQMPLLELIHIKLPMIMFGAAGLMGGTIIFFSPESKNMPIHQNLEEVIRYEKNKKNIN